MVMDKVVNQSLAKGALFMADWFFREVLELNLIMRVIGLSQNTYK